MHRSKLKSEQQSVSEIEQVYGKDWIYPRNFDGGPAESTTTGMEQSIEDPVGINHFSSLWFFDFLDLDIAPGIPNCP